MSNLNSFINEVIECQKLDNEGSQVVQEQSFAIPTDIVLDGIDMIATVQAPA